MVWETLIICITLYAIFGEYFRAKAEWILECTREKEIENDRKETE